MSDSGDLWRRYAVAEIGLSVDFCNEPAVESLPIEGGRSIYQRISVGDALLFLRYGRQETLENLIASMKDLITTVSLLNETPVSYCGEDAKHFTLVATRQSVRAYRYENESLVDEEHPQEQTVISVISFTRKGVPVLLGYRVPEARIDSCRFQLERFINSGTAL